LYNPPTKLYTARTAIADTSGGAFETEPHAAADVAETPPAAAAATAPLTATPSMTGTSPAIFAANSPELTAANSAVRPASPASTSLNDACTLIVVASVALAPVKTKLMSSQRVYRVTSATSCARTRACGSAVLRASSAESTARVMFAAGVYARCAAVGGDATPVTAWIMDATRAC
jgi:hypothetical protein